MSINERASVDFDKIIELYHTFCPSLPRVFKMSDKRKNKIVVRLEEMSQGVTTLQKVFEKVEASKFMRGDNPRGWKCDFDWIIANSGNWVKVLEGKYDNRNIPETNGTNEQSKTRVIATQAERNESVSNSQKCDILNTLSKCMQDYDAGNLPTLTVSQEDL